MYYLSEPLRVKAGRTVAPMPDVYERSLERAPGSGAALWASSPSGKAGSQAAEHTEPAREGPARELCSAEAHCMASAPHGTSEGFTALQVFAVALSAAAAGFVAARPSALWELYNRQRR